MKYYAAVWIDFLHGPRDEKIAVNVQESTREGSSIRIHRAYWEHLGDEDEIVAKLLPGAVHYTKADS